nr:MAG TPA: hypothetical protein [Caudoviricetes sp.]
MDGRPAVDGHLPARSGQRRADFAGSRPPGHVYRGGREESQSLRGRPQERVLRLCAAG